MKPEKIEIGKKYKIIFPAHIKKWMIDNNEAYRNLSYYIEQEMLHYDNKIVTISKRSDTSQNWFFIEDIHNFIWPKSFFHDVRKKYQITFYGSLKALIENESIK